MTILDQIEDRLCENHGHAFLYQYILSLSKHVPYFKSTAIRDGRRLRIYN